MANSNNVIVDPAGNVWTITSGGQVAINGVADPTTSNVTELVYAGQQVWQENASGLWWAKSSPTAAWVAGAGSSGIALPASIVIASVVPGARVDQSLVSVTATAGDHMLFLAGSDDTVSLSGGVDTVTDTGRENTYVLPKPGSGIDIFADNILAIGDTLAFGPALAATRWNGCSATLSQFLSVTDSGHNATVALAATRRGAGVTIATIDGAGRLTLAGLLAHSTT